MKKEIENLIKQALLSLGIETESVLVEYPGDMTHGDFATNVAMLYAKGRAQNPKDFALELVSVMKSLPLPEGETKRGWEQISVAGPGFINFKISKEYFFKELEKIHTEKKNYGKSEIYKGKKILVEHSSPNLFKPFHIGHVMNNTIGESITRIARASGADVSVISYPSDISLGIGKAVYIMLLDGLEKIQSLDTDTDKLAYLGECYVRGTKMFEDSDEVKSRVKEITKNLYEKISSPELDAYEIGKEINLQYFIHIVARLGSHFDNFIFESEAGKVGQKIVEENTPNIFTKSNGAVVYEGEKEGLHTRVFINSEGYPTYESKDVGLMSLKFERYNPDISIFITDHEQTNYFEVVKNASSKINKEWEEKTVHRTHGRMTFKGQKMSSRLGGVPLAATLIDTVVEEVKEKNPDIDNKSADMIAIGSLKYAILRAKAGSNINFDPETSLSFEGDSGPYLQYTLVRAKSVLNKAREQGFEPKYNPEKEIGMLEKYLTRFPSIVDKSINEWAPHHISGYTIEIAHLFNSWYGNTKIISEDREETEHNLFITSCLVSVLEKGIKLLGIAVPEKM